MMKKRRKPKAKLFAAVVIGKPGVPSGRPFGDWGCFVGPECVAIISQALKARGHWERSGAYGPYRILVESLTEEVQTPTNYKLVRLKGGAR